MRSNNVTDVRSEKEVVLNLAVCGV